MSDPRDRIDDPDVPPSEEERAAAENLRAALEDPARPNDDAALARALSSAWSPRDLPADVHLALVAKALALRTRRRGVVVRVSFGASAVLALAAAVLLLVRSDRQSPDTVHSVAVIAVSRSTQALFPDRFPATGGETARIDRIA
ncbi:MAG TPA: hypothetical protein VIY73_06320, partial [Polyangiaceae bacterium]